MLERLKILKRDYRRAKTDEEREQLDKLITAYELVLSDMFHMEVDSSYQCG